MKSIALSFVLILAVARGYPQPVVTADEKSMVVGVILEALENARNNIIEGGLDPLFSERLDINLADLGYSWAVDGLLSLSELASTGLSSFVVNRMNYATLTSRLTFDLAIPQLTFGIGDAQFRGTVIGNAAEGDGSGRVGIFNPRVWGEVRVSVGIISGISIRDLQVNFNLDRIQSDINSLNYNGVDYTEQANDLLGNAIPTFVNENQDLITEWLTNMVQEVIDNILS